MEISNCNTMVELHVAILQRTILNVEEKAHRSQGKFEITLPGLAALTENCINKFKCVFS